MAYQHDDIKKTVIYQCYNNTFTKINLYKTVRNVLYIILIY